MVTAQTSAIPKTSASACNIVFSSSCLECEQSRMPQTGQTEQTGRKSFRSSYRTNETAHESNIMTVASATSDKQPMQDLLWLFVTGMPEGVRSIILV